MYYVSAVAVYSCAHRYSIFIRCWLSKDSGVIWTFIAPVIVIFVVSNLILQFMQMAMLMIL